MNANSKKYQNLRREKHATSVVCDTYDLKAYEKLKGQARKLQELEESGKKELPTFSPLMQDVYSSLYKFAPELRSSGEILPSHRFHRSVIEQLMKTSEFKELRTYTKLDEFNSAMATLSLAGKALTFIPKEIQDKTKEMNNLEGQIESLEDQAEGLENLLSQAVGQIAKAKAAGQGTKSLETKVSNLETQASGAEMSLEEAKQKLENLEQALEDEVNVKTPELRGAIRQATKDALEEVKETSEFLEQWGSDAGEIQNMPVEQKIRRAQVLQNSDKMRQLAKLVGKFKRLALSAQRTKIKQAPIEVYDVVRGSDLDRVLPTEFDNLAHPMMKLDFYKRYVEGNLLIYEKKGKEKVGKGPIIVCCDNSGSMKGSKEFWSKAVALALLEIAKLQKRNYACIHFGAESTPTKCIEVPNGKASFETAVEIGSYFLNDSGTGFMRPLNEATSLIEKQEFKKADVVFITDGECSVSDEFLRKFKETKKAKAFKVTSILVDMGSTTPTAVAEFSDDVQFVSELSGEEAGEIFARI